MTSPQYLWGNGVLEMPGLASSRDIERNCILWRMARMAWQSLTVSVGQDLKRPIRLLPGVLFFTQQVG